MVDSMQPKPFDNVHVVQALGGVGPPEAKAHATDISRRLSQLLNAKLTLLPAPGIIGSAEARDILLNAPQVRNALNLFPKINSLFVGIGSIKTNPVLNTTNAEMSDLFLKRYSIQVPLEIFLSIFLINRGTRLIRY